MAFARLQKLLPLILPKAPGCPGVTAMQQARLAAIDFCERTRCWRQITTLTVAPPGVAIPVAPDEAAIYEIEYATFNDQPLQPTQHTDLANMPNGAPLYVSQVAPGQISVFPIREAGELKLSLFLKPRLEDEYGTDPADPLFNRFDVVPDWMIPQHGHRLVDGALSKILAIPDEPWTDLQRAGFHGALFDEACASKFRQQIRGQHRARIRTSYQGF